jgi:hypothetical protein
MSRYYVEIYQPYGVKAEAWAQHDSFDDALDWLEQRKNEDPKRTLRIRGDLSPEQWERLARLGEVEQF